MTPDAARLFGAGRALRENGGFAPPGVDRSTYDADLTAVRDGLGEEQFARAWAEGLSLTVAEAVAYASRRRGPRSRPVQGWASLTPAESDVARLAAAGLTNREIGERLFISPRTAGTHLARVFAKLSVSSRKELDPRA